MGAAAPIAGVATVASLGLGAAGNVMKGEASAAQMRAQGQATMSADYFQADKLDRAAEFGKTQAILTNTTYRENLNTTLDNIEAVRAAAGTDPSSPTTAALMDRSEMISDRQRMAAVGTIKSQVAEDEASAAYLRKAGDFAVTTANQAADNAESMGWLGGLTSLFGGVAKMGVGGG